MRTTGAMFMPMLSLGSVVVRAAFAMFMLVLSLGSVVVRAAFAMFMLGFGGVVVCAALAVFVLVLSLGTAVLPIENSFAGEVAQVTDLLFSGSLSVSGMYDLSVTQNLLTLPGVDASAVKTVISHPQALSQCEAYIRKMGYETRPAENTAIAAKLVKEMGDPTVAAIGAEENAQLYGLTVADHAVNESAGNTTRFAVFTRARHPIPKDAMMN